MTPLARLLAERIAATGPITVSDYMAECLLHPDHGYYTTRDPLGAAGDFTTAPEISQMFGELLGLALAQAWLDQGSPPSILLAELGPGRGTLMADVLRATARVPGFASAATVHFVEASPTLREEQRKRVPQANWHASVADLPEGPIFLLANEFFDALPIRQFVRAGPLWAERVVGLSDNRLAWGLASPAVVPALLERRTDTEHGDMVEVCPPLRGIMGELGRRIATHGGAALLVDYGGWDLTGDSLQAVRRHAYADPLDAPGEADLTAHVDFEALAHAAAPAAATPMTTQGAFLERLGITPRAQLLARSLSGEPLAAHVAAHRRLTHPDEMGTLFKVMGVHPQDAPPPPGFTD